MDPQKIHIDMDTSRKYQTFSTGYVSVEIDLIAEEKQYRKLKLIKGLEEPSNFGEVFKRARLECGLSQEKLAKIVKCSTVSISLYERNLKYPKRLNVEKFEKALGVKLAHLIPPEDKIPDFANKIKNARLAKNLTRQHLADMLGCHVNTVMRWERDEKYPRYPSVISKLEKILDVKFSLD